MSSDIPIEVIWFLMGICIIGMAVSGGNDLAEAVNINLVLFYVVGGLFIISPLFWGRITTYFRSIGWSKTPSWEMGFDRWQPGQPPQILIRMVIGT